TTGDLLPSNSTATPINPWKREAGRSLISLRCWEKTRDRRDNLAALFAIGAHSQRLYRRFEQPGSPSDCNGWADTLGKLAASHAGLGISLFARNGLQRVFRPRGRPPRPSVPTAPLRSSPDFDGMVAGGAAPGVRRRLRGDGRRDSVVLG